MPTSEEMKISDLLVINEDSPGASSISATAPHDMIYGDSGARRTQL